MVDVDHDSGPMDHPFPVCGTKCLDLLLKKPSSVQYRGVKQGSNLLAPQFVPPPSTRQGRRISAVLKDSPPKKLSSSTAQEKRQ